MRRSLAAAVLLLVAVLTGAVVLAAPLDADELRLDERFNANDSLVDKPVMCSEEERSCLSLGLLFHAPTGQCLPLGYSRKAFHSDCIYAAKPCRFNGGAGRLQAECLARAECAAAGSGVGRPLAFSGRCAPAGAVCACDGRPPAGLHLFGGAQCDCSAKRRGRGRRRRRLLQPTEPGRCNVPDFSADLHAPDAPTGGAPARVRCPPQQSQCARDGQVWHDGACWPLLSQGPCDDNFIVAFPWRHPRRFATCVRNETCQQGRLRFAADPHNCHAAALFGDGDDGGRLRRDARGLWRVSFRGRHPRDPAPLFVCGDDDDEDDEGGDGGAPGEAMRRRGGRERLRLNQQRRRRPARRRRGKNEQSDGKRNGKREGKKKQRKTSTTSRGQ